MTPTTNSQSQAVEDVERKKFEDFACDEFKTVHRKGADYRERDVSAAWSAWKARADLASPLEVAAPVTSDEVQHGVNALHAYSGCTPKEKVRVVLETFLQNRAASRAPEVVRAEPSAEIVINGEGDVSIKWTGKPQDFIVGGKLYTAPPKQQPALGRGDGGGVTQWQPIETAPKDGSYVLVTSTHNPYLRGVVQYLDGQWIDWNENDQTRLMDQAATHHMPLQPPPAPRPSAPTGQINSDSAGQGMEGGE